MNQQRNLLLILSIAFFIVFALSATFTITAILINFIYFSTIFALFIISVFANKFLNSNFRKGLKKILLVSIVGLFLGILTITPQKKINENKAIKLISEIETFKKLNGKFPKENQIEIPKSVNGLNVEKFQYIYPFNDCPNYIIKYFDGFWDSKVYLSEEKKWYTDD